MGLGSGIRKKPIPDSGSRSQKGTGSRIQIRNTAPSCWESTALSIVENSTERGVCLYLETGTRGNDRRERQIWIRDDPFNQNSAPMQVQIQFRIRILGFDVKKLSNFTAGKIRFKKNCSLFIPRPSWGTSEFSCKMLSHDFNASGFGPSIETNKYSAWFFFWS